MKRINLSLSEKSIQAAIEKLQEYKMGLKSKAEIFVLRLAQEGIEVAESVVFSGAGDTPPAVSLRFQVMPGVDIAGCKIIMSSDGKEFNGAIFYPHLAFEFGAGIYYNNGSGNPYASELGMGPGTFPGQRWAINPGYWWYKEGGEDRASHLSYGTQATMPMYNATLEIIRKTQMVAKEVFRG